MHSSYLIKLKINKYVLKMTKNKRVVPGRHWVMIAKLSQAPAWRERPERFTDSI